MKTLVDFISCNENHLSLDKFITEACKYEVQKPCSFSALKKCNKELYNLIEKDSVLSEISKIKGLKFQQNSKENKNLVTIEMNGSPSQNDEVIKQIKEITGKYVNFGTNKEYWNDGHTSKYKPQFGFYNLDNGKIYDEYNKAKEGK